MSGDHSDGLNLDDGDRLPWLEPAGDYDEQDPPSPLKLLGLVALGLGLLCLIVGGGYWLKSRNAGGEDGEAKLIAAQGATYKIPANASDAKEFDGEGDSSFEASEGTEGAGRIDASKVPEAPRTDLKAAAAKVEPLARPATVAKPTVTAAVKTVPVDPKKTNAATGTAAEAGAPRIQLGAFGSKELAESVWKKLSGRFDYVGALTHSVEPVETGGKTLFRLRATVASASDATATCGKLRVAGENCMVVR